MNPQEERERELFRVMRREMHPQADTQIIGVGVGGGNGRVGTIADMVGVFDGEVPRIVQFNNHNNNYMSEIEETMKQRHLSKNERARLHQPKPDWKETPKGEVCKNSSTLEVEDIISKHNR